MKIIRRPRLFLAGLAFVIGAGSSLGFASPASAYTARITKSDMSGCAGSYCNSNGTSYYCPSNGGYCTKT
jgi:hypothetical protein